MNDPSEASEKKNLWLSSKNGVFQAGTARAEQKKQKEKAGSEEQESERSCRRLPIQAASHAN